MRPIRALIADDEVHSRASVRALLMNEPRWQILGEYEHTAEVRAAISRSPPDVVFLDIRMPGQDGIRLAQLLQQLRPRPLVVFTTAFEGYALDAFEVQAFDYLLKPFDDARFVTALRRIEEALSLSDERELNGRRDAAEDEDRASDRYARRIVIQSIGRIQFVDVARIDWIEAAGNYIEIHAGDESVLHRERLHALEARLDPARFVRIHRSIIVNRAVVKELRPIAAGDYLVVLRNDERLRLSRNYRAALESLKSGL